MASTVNKMKQPSLSSSGTDAPASSRTSHATMFVRLPPTHGIRRQRDDSVAVEIEELDSCTMRQNSYNYFQHHGTGTMSSLLRTSTFSSSLGRSPASRKRQRTLAEQMDELCLQSQGMDSESARNRSKNRSSMRRARAKSRHEGANHSARIVEIDAFGQETALSPESSGSDNDGMMDTSEDVRRNKKVEEWRHLLTAGSSNTRSHIDKIYRHYVTAAAQGTPTTAPHGQELVLFKSSVPTRSIGAVELPGSMPCRPDELKNMSTAEKQQWYQAYRCYMGMRAAEQKNDKKMEMQVDAKATELAEPVNTFKCRRSSASVPYEQGEKNENDVEEFEDVMMEGMDDDAVPKCPHAAGTLTHTEWFLDDGL